MEVRLYGKPGCHLCEQAEELIEDLSTDYPLVLQMLDITADPTLYERFRYEIPVIELADGRSLSGRISREALRELLRTSRAN